MKKILFCIGLISWLGMTGLTAQKTWILPEEINPADSVTIYVDIKACECQRLLGATEVFLWTWLPEGERDEPYDNGEWTASNPFLSMKSEGNDVWSYTMIPTEFYGVDAQTVFDNDFAFLVKASDGSGEGGGGCDEDKTEDLSIEVDAPVTGPRKVYGFPARSDKDTVYTTQEDIFSFFYDNKLEEKETMIDPGELFVYARATTVGGEDLRIAPIAQVKNNPQLKMEAIGDGIYRWVIIPKEMFELSGGQSLASMKLQIMKPDARNTSDIVEGEFDFILRCE